MQANLIRGTYTASANTSGADSAAVFTLANTGKLEQTISFDAIADHTYGDLSFSLYAAANSGLAVTFSIVSGPATLLGNVLSITGAGQVIVRADQAGNDLYDPADPVSQSFEVYKESPRGCGQ